MDTKQYILSIQAQLKGDKVVLTGLKQLDGEISKFKKTVDLSGKSTQSLGDIIESAGKRALIVAPIWMLLRSAMLAVIQTTQKIIQDNIKFEDSMSDVRTMLEGTATDINAQMIAIKRVILDTATNSRRSLGDLTDGFRYLKSANLDFQQTMAGFPVVASLMNAFGLSAQEASRAVAGMANTADTALGQNISMTDKFAKIGDILAYTYVKQDVLVNELIQSYANFAPYITTVNDDFLTIMTTLGFLNTHMLRAGRTGTITGRAIVEMVSSADKLASIFGITFDASKPLTFLSALEQIRNKLGQNTQLTIEQAKAIQDTFGVRASLAVNLLLSNFDKLKEAIQDARDNSEGFLKRIEEIRMGTVEAQLTRMSNIVSVLGNDFISASFATGDFAMALDNLNDSLSAKGARDFAKGLGYVTNQVGVLSATILGLGDVVFHPIDDVDEFIIRLKTVQELLKVFKTPIKFFEEQEQLVETAKKESAIRQQIGDFEKEYKQLNANILKQEREGITRNINLLKIMGANELDIAQYKLQSLEMLKEYLDTENYVLEKQKAENDLLEAQIKYRQQIVNIYQKASVDLLRTMGATESQILTVRMKILEANRSAIGDAQFLVQMEDLRLQRIIAIEAERQKELQTYANLVNRYHQADEVERGRIRRLMELQRLTPEQLAKQYQKDMFDRNVIDQYFSDFSEKGRQAVTKVQEKLYDLPQMPEGELATEETLPVLFQKVFSPDTVGVFWDSWTQRQEQALNRFGERWSALANDFQGVEKFADKLTQQAIQQNVDLGTRIEKIEINIPANALQTLAEQAGQMVTQELQSNEELAKKIAKITRPYL